MTREQLELTIGPLAFVGELAGAHVHVTIRAAGPLGSRPLCGRVTVRVDEWYALRLHADVAAIATMIGKHWHDQEGVNGALLDELAELTRRAHG